MKVGIERQGGYLFYIYVDGEALKGSIYVYKNE